MDSFLQKLGSSLAHRFSLAEDKSNEREIVESICEGIHFRGVRVWVLVSAILLASVGLNVNSIPVIIGAMLISPLMGPIMGLGLGAGIFDFALIRSSLKNLAVMVAISMASSTIYFYLSPLDQAQSELLARTAPTIWDVLIAFFGGVAGIVAGNSKSKGTVVPGVAIATALMPPLCTAGFGLAHGNWEFFFGAIYLFCINTVFIGASTFFIVRLLKFDIRTFVNERTHQRVRNWILGLVVVTMVPSLYIAYVTVERVLFTQNADRFIAHEIESANTHVLVRDLNFNHDSISVVVVGKTLDTVELDSIQARKKQYGLPRTSVVIRQGLGEAKRSDLAALQKEMSQELIAMQINLETQRSRLVEDSIKHSGLQVDSVAREAFALNGKLTSLGLARVPYSGRASGTTDTLLTAFLGSKRYLTRRERAQLQAWLKERMHADTIVLVVSRS